MTVLQGTGVTEGAPPIEGIGAQLTFVAFLVVMLIVPWFMSRTPCSATVASDVPGPEAMSDRERRLWIWVAVVMVAILSTLGPAAEVAGWLRARNLLRITTGAFLVAVAVALAVPWARRRPGRREVGAAIGIAAVYLTTTIRLPVPEARSHLFEYGLVAMLVYHALIERRASGRSVPAPAVLAWSATALLGWIDEGIQALLPSRTYDLLDVGFNALAALMAIAATVLMGWARSLDLFRRGGPP